MEQPVNRSDPKQHYSQATCRDRAQHWATCSTLPGTGIPAQSIEVGCLPSEGSVVLRSPGSRLKSTTENRK